MKIRNQYTRKEHEVDFYWGKYLNGNTFLGLMEKEEGPYADITVNIEELPETCLTLDTNNFPQGEEIIQEAGGELIGYLMSGYCSYPVYMVEKEWMIKNGWEAKE